MCWGAYCQILLRLRLWPRHSASSRRHQSPASISGSIVKSATSIMPSCYRTVQWMFHKSQLLASRSHEARDNANGSYVELVVSRSRRLVEKSKTEIVDMAVKEAQEFFPAAREAKLLKSTVIKEINATYSPRPGIDQYRP